MVENGCLGESERIGKVSLEPTMRSVKVVVDTCTSNGHFEANHNGNVRIDGISVEWKNLTFHTKIGKERKSLVSNLSGVARPGTLTAIMGSSGAGKTTLLNILTGFYDDSYEGEVQVNGYVRDRQLFNRQSCYVMQEDRLLPVLTVQEALAMSVGLRLPTLTEREKANVVQRSVREWGLIECCHTRTENLSGGEKKRLAIAQELVSNPAVIFLDEPTSGLDNVSSLMCVQVLKGLARKGHTVVCSLQAPSAKLFSHFDMLYMLSEGCCIYNGHVSNLLGFLSQHHLNCPEYHNPADYIAEVAAGAHGNQAGKLASHFTLPPPPPAASDARTTEFETKYGGRIMSTQEKKKVYSAHSCKVSQFYQFRILLKRCWLSTTRNRVAAPLRFAGYVAFAILLIALFYNIGRKATMVIHTAKMYFTVIAILYFQSLIPTVIVFPIEVLVLLRENRNSWYSINTYYLANYLAELPFLTVPVIMFIALIYYPTAQPLEMWRAAGVMLFSVQLASVVQSMGLMVSAVAKLQTAVYVAIPVVSPSFIFGGFCVQDQLLQPWVRWLTSLSPCNYAYHGILLSVYGYDREPLDCDDDFLCLYEHPEDFLEFTGSSGKKLHVLSLALLLFDVVFRLLALVLLRWRLSKRQ
ncbi:unnamed protein product [Ixodes pacificus]